MGMIRAALLCVWFAGCCASAELTIDGEWKAIDPSPQPTRLIESPFALELDTTPDQIVTWTWDRGLSVWKTQDNRLEVEAPDGVYRVGWTIRRINFTEGRIDTDSGSLIFQTGKEGPVDPGQPDKPTPDPDHPGDERIKALAAKAVSETGDPSTASALGKFYIEWAASADATQSKARLRDSVRKGSGTVLLNRDGDANWESAWRVPLSALLSGSNASEYVEKIGYAGRQLVASSASVRRVEDKKSPKPLEGLRRVTIYTKPGCEPCERWKQEVAPVFRRSKFDVVTAPATPGRPAPYFEAIYNGQFYEVDEYLSPKLFNRLVEKRTR